MSIKPKTIDNMGIDVSSRYAKNQEIFDPKLIKESDIVAAKVVSSSMLSTAIPIASEIFTGQLVSHTIWAIFAPPKNYYSNERGLFSYELIPSLGGWEKREANADKLAKLAPTLKDDPEFEAIQSLLQSVDTQSRDFDLINARRNQYQKG
jgi:hypothetical protein